MKDLIPASPSDHGLQLMTPMDQPPPPPPASKFRLHKLVICLKHFWWIPVITATLGLAIGFTIFFNTPPTFVASGSLYETLKLRLPDGAAFTDDRDNYLGTQSQLLRSQMLRQRTLAWMRANSVNNNNIVVGENGEPIPVEIEVFATPRSSIYIVEARSANPAFTPLFLNALMKQYLEYRKNVRKEVSGDTLASISEQVQKLEREVKVGQSVLQDYERSNNFAVLQQQSVVEAAYLSKLKTELSDYQLQMKLLESISADQNPLHFTGTNSYESVVNSLGAGSGGFGYTAGREDAARQIELLKIERERLSKYLRPEHPKIIKLDEDLKRAQKLVDVFRKQNQEQIGAGRQALQLKMANTEKFIEQWEKKVSESTERLGAANGLKESVARNQAMYDRLLSLLQNVDISRNIDQDTLTIMEPASDSRRSYKEAQALLVQSFMLGLAIGCGIIFFMAWRDDRFASMVEVTESFGDNVVGQVPDMPGSEIANRSPLALLQSNDDRHMFAESYRNLRSALLYLAVDGKRPRTLLITSAVPNEGKSTVATNLARAMALGGSKVILVDGDLRKGHIHELLKMEAKPGFTELLRRHDDYKSYIRPTDLDNFHFMPRGSICHNPGDLFLNPAFDELLNTLRGQYDYVIIDSSPVFAADDSSTLAPKMDGTLFVVRSRFSNARAVREALNLLFQRQARVLGLILNRADTGARSYYAYKYAEYYAHSGKDEADEKT